MFVAIRVRVLLLCIIILTSSMFSQKQTNIWYFGALAGMDFSTNPPTILANNSMTANEGCSSISDYSGNLLFYSNGITVWNKSHSIMANGTGLLGGVSSSQACLIAKQPGNTNIYYVLTTDHAGASNGFRYSIVDMNLAAGMGSVTVKNATICTPVAEKLCAIRHANGVDVWIIVHEMPTNVFRSYLLSISGLNAAVTSPIGSPHIYNGLNGMGYLKASPNGKKLAAALEFDGVIELFDYNTNTGVVSNSLSINTNTSNINSYPYGVEFSPDGTKLYGSITGYSLISQWDLCAGSNSAIIASVHSMSASSAGALQLASNGKIYISNNVTSTLGVISNPNAPGSACNYVQFGLPVGPGVCRLGLPNSESGQYKFVPPFTYTITPPISCLNATFTPPAFQNYTTCFTGNCNYTGTSWIFGDPAAGSLNTSTLNTPPVHQYSGPGKYLAKLVLYSPCGTDTAYNFIELPIPNLSSATSATICSGQSLTLLASGAVNYTWMPVSQGNSVVVSPTANIVYTVTGADTSGYCLVSKTLAVTVLPAPTISLTGNFTICPKQTATITASGGTSYSWSNGSVSTSITVSPTVTTVYSVSVQNFSCASSSSFTITLSSCLSLSDLSITSVQIGIYPNPNTGEFTISASEKVKLNLFNSLGQLIEIITLDGKQTDHLVKNLPAGVYFVVSSEPDQRFMQKIVVVAE
jgi:hypothetical protein